MRSLEILLKIGKLDLDETIKMALAERKNKCTSSTFRR